MVVGDRVVLDLHRETLHGRVHRGALGHRPPAHDPVELEAEIKVVRPRLVLLDNEHAGGYPADCELVVPVDRDNGHRHGPDGR